MISFDKKASAMETFVCTVAGEIVGVLYGQRISLGEAQMPQQTWRRRAGMAVAGGNAQTHSITQNDKRSFSVKNDPEAR